MSYDDYVNYIVQKYRLAVSLALIRTKPQNTPLEEYVQQLRNKVNEERTNSDDLNISLCSDDFHIDETGDFSINIDKNIDNIDSNNDGITRSEGRTDENRQKIVTNMQNLIDLTVDIDHNNGSSKNYQVFDDKTDEIYHQHEANDVEMTDTQDLNDSIRILEHFQGENANFHENNSGLDESSNLEDAMHLLKSIHDDSTTQTGISNKNSTHNRIPTQASKMDIIESNVDKDATLCGSLELLTNIENYVISQKLNYNLNKNYDFNNKDEQIEKNMLMIDASANLITNSKEIDINKEMNKNNTNNTTFCANTSELEQPSNNKKQEFSLEDRFQVTECKQSKVRDYRHKNEFKNVYHNVAQIFDAKNNPFEVKDDQSTKDNIILNKCKINKNKLDNTIDFIADDLTCKTHYSESQVNDIIVIEDKYIHGTNKNKQNKDKSGTAKKDIDKVYHDSSKDTQEKNFSSDNSRKYEANMTIHNEKNNKITEKLNDSEKFCNEISNDTQQMNFSSNSTTKCGTNLNIHNEKDGKITEKHTKRKSVQIDDEIFSQESQINFFTSTNSSQKCDNNNEKDYEKYKHAKSRVKYIDHDLFSQESQFTCFSTLTTNSQNNITQNGLAFTQDGQNMDECFDQVRILRTQDSITYNEQVKDITNQSYIDFDKINNAPNVTNQTESNSNFDKAFTNVQNTNEIRTERVKNLEVEQLKHQKNCTNFDNSQTLDEKHKNVPETKGCTNSDDNLQMEAEEWTDSQTEVIPFKVIEELNKIKNYLKKKSGVETFSNDTGYKSDSQSKNSLKISQSANGWLDQSAHCIFQYVTECPLTVTTQDIANEISVVLGQLIDKLHEEEIYPTFLEELLDTVHLLLGIVYGENTDENVLMKKDETIQRILLLNKSIHIQKYTIEKITYILENVHTELTTDDSMYEIKNIDQIENVCYIFHILEMILLKYKKCTQNLSQSTQNSQEEKVLKKSNIMDIWRKKWNANYKETENEGSTEKICITSDCSTILNKLIVSCMDGYSLISYFALKCFNVMQT